MPGLRRPLSLASCTLIAFIVTLVYLYGLQSGHAWRDRPYRQGLSELLGHEYHIAYNGSAAAASMSSNVNAGTTSNFRRGRPKPAGSTYTRHLIVAKTKEEDASWVTDEDLGGAEPKVYVVDDRNATLHVPKNKGHEGMVYLTYLIDHYANLPDVAVFMHAHQKSWHQGALLDHDGAETVRRLSSERVTREGYMNLRCEWNPGCPRWLHPGRIHEDSEKMEEPLMAQVWAELFPGVAIPDVIAQPCCAQFALSRERILSIPFERLVFYRAWLLRTRILDEISGRILEYLWQVMFAGQAVLCPNMHACYCDGYGICFEDAKEFDRWYRHRWQRQTLIDDIKEVKAKEDVLDQHRQAGVLVGVEGLELDIPDSSAKEDLDLKVRELEKSMAESRLRAIERGRDPSFRAQVAGRPWREGDGF